MVDLRWVEWRLGFPKVSSSEVVEGDDSLEAALDLLGGFLLGDERGLEFPASLSWWRFSAAASSLSIPRSSASDNDSASLFDEGSSPSSCTKLGRKDLSRSWTGGLESLSRDSTQDVDSCSLALSLLVISGSENCTLLCSAPLRTRNLFPMVLASSSP